MKTEPVIKVNSLTKEFSLPHEKFSTAKQRFVNVFTRKSYENFMALNNVSFEIEKGEFFGIIGSNGSGKSTLLKILAKIYQPSKGSVEIKGRVAPFIELGVGFNPELTARENVFLNSAILGLSKKETEKKFAEIIKFAELENFVDQKLKNFSSGMQVRLAFAIAIQAHTEILLVDEVLAVGDANFQQKCFDVFRKLKGEKKTIVFVSHALNIIEEFCDRVALIDKSRLISIGKPRNVINDYLSIITDKETRGMEVSEKGKSKKEERWGDGQAEIVDLWFENIKGAKVSNVGKDDFILNVVYQFNAEIIDPIFGFIIRDSLNRDVVVSNTKWLRVKTGRFTKGRMLQLAYKIANVLEDGRYTVSPAIANQDGIHFYDWRNNFKKFIISKEVKTGAFVNIPIEVNLKEVIK